MILVCKFKNQRTASALTQAVPCSVIKITIFSLIQLKRYLYHVHVDKAEKLYQLLAETYVLD